MDDNDDSGGHDPRRPIGRGNPPREGQFKAGNPGRRRGSKNKPFPSLNSLAAGWIVKKNEIHSVTQSGRTVRQSGVSLFNQSMFQGAIKREPAAIRAVLRLEAEAEKQRERRRQEDMEIVLAYQSGAYQEIKSCQQQGVSAPEIYPHPDNVFYDEDRGKIVICGPVNRQQKEGLDRAAVTLRSWTEERDGILRDMAADPDPGNRPLYEEDLAFATYVVRLYSFVLDRLWSGIRLTRAEIMAKEAELRRQVPLMRERSSARGRPSG